MGESRVEPIALGYRPIVAVVPVFDFAGSGAYLWVTGGHSQQRVRDQYLGFVLAGNGLCVRYAYVTDAQGMAFALGMILDRNAPNTEHLADLVGQYGRMTTGLSRKDFDERVFLIVRRTVVKIESKPPLGFRHVSRGVNRRSNVQSIEPHVAVMAVANVPTHKCGALAFLSAN